MKVKQTEGKLALLYDTLENGQLENAPDVDFTEETQFKPKTELAISVFQTATAQLNVENIIGQLVTKQETFDKSNVKRLENGFYSKSDTKLKYTNALC